jgi:hypothetical protein
MFNIASVKNLPVLIKPLGSRGASVTAGGTGDATLVTGNTVDRFTTSGGTITAVGLSVIGQASVGASETLGLTIGYQTSANGSDWDTAVYVFGASESAYVTVVTGATTNGSVSKVVTLDCAGLKRYVRILYKPDLSRANTDTAVLVGSVIALVNTVETLEND